MKYKSQMRNITPENAQTILSEMGISISTPKAALVLDLMYKMAILEVSEFNKEK